MLRILAIIAVTMGGASFGALFGMAPAAVLAQGFAPGSVFPLVMVTGCALLGAVLAGVAAASEI